MTEYPKPPAKTTLSRNGLRPSVARRVARQVQQEREMTESGELAWLYRLGRQKRAEMIKKN